VKALRNPLLHRTAAIALGAVFVYASLDKIAHPREFARIVYRYQLLGPSATLGVVPANALAIILPWIEAVAGLSLIVGVWRREASAVVSVLLVLFIAAVGYVLVNGIDVEHCGCFTVGGQGRSAGLALVAEDVALLAAALYVLLGRPAATS
jgi:uncharacterized membrane protein YphA (DoxX/SURF4 family)